jgi:hypothetical protein
MNNCLTWEGGGGFAVHCSTDTVDEIKRNGVIPKRDFAPFSLFSYLSLFMYGLLINIWFLFFKIISFFDKKILRSL